MNMNTDYMVRPAEEDSLLGGFHDAQLAYTRMPFGIETRPSDGERSRTGFSPRTPADLADQGSVR
jgi:hypothetical protein